MTNALKSVVKRVLRRLRLYHPTPPVYVHPPSPLESCFDALVRLGFEPRCLIDVGANHGNWTRTALRFFPGLQVVMVEPQEWLRSSSEDILRTNPEVRWVTAGASDAEATLALTVADRDDSSSFLPSAVEARARGLRQVEVRVTTVARLVEELAVPSPDIIKIDAEGLDLKVLAGCGKFLGETDLFFVEASLLRGAKENALFKVVEFMRTKGYGLFDLTDLNRSPNCGALCLVEMAFVRDGSDLRQRARW